MMTQAQRNKIEKQLEIIEAARNAIGEIADDLRGKLDDRSDSWRDSERGQQAEDMVDTVETFVANIETECGDLYDAMDAE